MKILIVTHGTFGDNFPMAGIAKTIYDAGHDVTFVCNKKFISHARTVGVPSLYHVENLMSEFAFHQNQTHTKHTYEIISNKAREGLGYLESLHEKKQFDLVIRYFLEASALLLAKKYTIPYINCFLTPSPFYSRSDPPFFDEGWLERYIVSNSKLGVSRKVSSLIINNRVKGYRYMCKQIGIDDGLFHVDISPLSNWVISSSVLFPPQIDWPANTSVTGYPFVAQQVYNTSIENMVQGWVGENPDPIILTLGSSSYDDELALYTAMIKSIHRLFPDQPLLVVTHKGLKDKIKYNNVLVVERINYAHIFPRAKLIFHQGGMGTTLECLRAGVPQIIVSRLMDRPDNAKRLEKLGVGRYVPKLTQDNILKAVVQMTRSEVQTTAQRIANEIKNHDWKSNIMSQLQRVT